LNESSKQMDRASRLEEAVRLKRARARLRGNELPMRPADRPATLGPMQRSLWLLDKMEPGSPAYNLCSAFRVRGEIDIDRLRRAIDSVVSRHRLLRSSFRETKGAVVQEIHTTSAIEVQQIDAGTGDLETAAAHESRRPFDLTTGPLLRVGLVRQQASREQLLLLVLHHIIADERSLAILWDEIAQAYNTEPPEPRGSAQYDDYVAWLETHGAPESERDADYWLKRLQSPPEPLELPFQSTPEGTRGSAGRLLSRDLGAAHLTASRRLAARLSVTPFVIYAFVFRALLQRYVGDERFAFATPASTRAHPATAKMVGYFLNPIVVPLKIDEALSAEDAILVFSDELQELLAHRSMPFEQLVERLPLERQGDRHPLFQVMFVHQQAARTRTLGESTLEPLTLDLGTTKFDLTLFVSEGEDSLQSAVEYRSALFDPVWMERLLEQYETLLGSLLDDPRQPVGGLTLLTDKAERRLRAFGSGGTLEAPRAPLPSQIRDQALRQPEAPAVHCAGVSLTYGELVGKADRVAEALVRRGVRPGDRVGLLIDRSDALLPGLLGILGAGAAYVPLDPSYPRSRNSEALRDAEVSTTVTRSGLGDDWSAAAEECLLVEGLAAEGLERELPPEPRLEDPAYVLYTSGSTGRPKGVVVSHDNLRVSTGARSAVYGRSPERFLLIPSIAFDSSVAGLFWTLAAGGELIVPTDEEARDPRLLAGLIRDRRVTALLCVPSLYAYLLASDPDLLATLDTVIVAGETCPSHLVRQHFRRLPNTRLYNEYGPTEATVWASVHEMTPADADQEIAIGRPIPGVQIEVVDGSGRRVPEGIPGEAIVSGPTVAVGYWNRPSETAGRFEEPVAGESSDRSYRTGDRVCWSTDGRLLFRGRLDEQVKLRGFRIEPGEIESLLLDQVGIANAVVVAHDGKRSHSGGGDGPLELVAFLELEGGARPPDSLQYLRERLPAHMVPGHYVVMNSLPRLPNGKVDRNRLREIPRDPGASPGVRQEASDLEASLVALWEALLSTEDVRLDDNFFELGGHSLLVIEMVAIIERDHGVELPVAEAFQYPTVRQLAQRIERRAGSPTSTYSHLFPIQPLGDERPLVVAIPHFFSRALAERFRGRRPVYGLRGVSVRSEGNFGRWRTMTDLGDELVDEIVRRFPGEEPDVAGYSFGASMAAEAVRLMEERQMPVRHLYLIAPMPLDIYRLGPVALQIQGLRQPIEALGLTEAVGLWLRNYSPLTPSPYRRLWRLLSVEARRHLLCAVGRYRKIRGLPLTEAILDADVRVDRFRLHRDYRPGSIRTPTTIFNPIETLADAAATWRPIFDGPLHVIDTPDPHLRGEALQQATELILDHLAEPADD
jgi:amino acid adenylation domain-containing protein